MMIWEMFREEKFEYNCNESYLFFNVFIDIRKGNFYFNKCYL